MKYTLPADSAKTQLQAFRDIVDLVTVFPGLRVHFLRAKCMESTTSMDTISALWDHPTAAPDEEWTFWKTFAATCLSNTTISAILETSSISKLTSCEEGWLSVVEKLLVEYQCSNSNICGALAIRYLAGILNLPGFWLEMGSVHSDVARKLCFEMTRILNDVGADILTLGPIDINPPFDYDGVDLLATAVLTGLSSWFSKLDEEHYTFQPWPRSVDLLPNASACATSALDEILPAVCQHAQVNLNIAVDVSPMSMTVYAVLPLMVNSSLARGPVPTEPFTQCGLVHQTENVACLSLGPL
ncbi:hypothetical protein B0H13DRAFT_2290937 [Mycena leptocephala]|nr:hypothetical protein B0H13DRAFT_2290937 [Mycena leptocephala]